MYSTNIDNLICFKFEFWEELYHNEYDRASDLQYKGVFVHISAPAPQCNVSGCITAVKKQKFWVSIC